MVPGQRDEAHAQHLASLDAAVDMLVQQDQPLVAAWRAQWRDQPAMESNLAKNQELKSALLEETPWVLQALDEKEQKKQIGLLFDLNRMGKEQTAALDKLADYQLPGGGFA